MNTYKGIYKPSDKYVGNTDTVIYRSLWELNTFTWLDSNPDVIKWSSEEIIIPYLCGTDPNQPKLRRYFPDLKIWFSDGRIIIVEIKPKKELKPPKTPKRKTRRYLNEIKTYIKNKSKWKAAVEYCLDRNIKFEIWTEDVLRSLGIKILK